ncbi:GtrA family protein [Ramlibacter sp.]|uniref:GtrA family protein n=1 Tax=Ramlibacter sp. TaxID=1917967 RepID=UPI002CAA3690|nr:GtrA family protein [Ramlibacter sp.]HWI81799.1 GtrA family protein [Ramlibacter sp.]
MSGLLRQSIRFGVVGAVNTGVGLAAIYGLMFFAGAAPAAANLAGYLLGMGVGFGLNRSWTFASGRPVADLLPRYVLVLALAYLANLAAVLAATSRLAWNPYLAQLAGIALYTFVAFLGCRRFVFARRVAA